MINEKVHYSNIKKNKLETKNKVLTGGFEKQQPVVLTTIRNEALYETRIYHFLKTAMTILINYDVFIHLTSLV